VSAVDGRDQTGSGGRSCGRCRAGRGAAAGGRENSPNYLVRRRRSGMISLLGGATVAPRARGQRRPDLVPGHPRRGHVEGRWSFAKS